MGRYIRTGFGLVRVITGMWTKDVLSQMMRHTENGDTFMITSSTPLKLVNCLEERMADMLQSFLKEGRKLTFGQLGEYPYVIIDWKHIFYRDLDGSGGVLYFHSWELNYTLEKLKKL